MKPFKELLILNTELCTGCQICELACSFNRVKVFQPSQSGIRVYRNNTEGTIEMEKTSYCDLCKTKRVPVCMQFCPSNALSLGRGEEESSLNTR